MNKISLCYKWINNKKKNNLTHYKFKVNNIYTRLILCKKYKLSLVKKS